MSADSANPPAVKDPSLSGLVGVYGFAIFLVAGPWIIMVAAIAILSALACPTNACGEIDLFRSILIYNFLLSLLLIGPISLPITRFVSDEIYAGRHRAIVSAFVAGLAVLAVAGVIVVGPFLIFGAQLGAPTKLAAFQNCMLMGAAWLIGPLLGALGDFRVVSLSFLAGACIMVGIAIVSPVKDALALLNAFSGGLAVANAGMLWGLMKLEPVDFRIDWRVFGSIRRYWMLGLIGLLYYLGIWIDNVVMWLASPSGVSRVGGVFQTMPDYDAVMFWAQLTTIPVLAYFAVNVEPRLSQLNRQFHAALGRHASRREIEIDRAALANFVWRSVLGIFVAAMVLMCAVMLASFWGIDRLGLRANQMGMFRAGLFGVAFHTAAMFGLMFMMFFDLRRSALAVSLVYFVLNGALTVAFMPLGFAYFGYGSMLAGALAFAVTLFLLARELPWLSYHAFVTNNVSLRGAS